MIQENQPSRDRTIPPRADLCIHESYIENHSLLRFHTNRSPLPYVAHEQEDFFLREFGEPSPWTFDCAKKFENFPLTLRTKYLLKTDELGERVILMKETLPFVQT